MRCEEGGQICCEGNFVEHILTVCLFVLTQWLQNICTGTEGWREGGGRGGGCHSCHPPSTRLIRAQLTIEKGSNGTLSIVNEPKLLLNIWEVFITSDFLVGLVSYLPRDGQTSPNITIVETYWAVGRDWLRRGGTERNKEFNNAGGGGGGGGG